MTQHPTYYRLTERRDEFDAGTTFKLVARYGDWHPQDAKLEVVDEDESGSIAVTIEELFDNWTGVATDSARSGTATTCTA